MPAYDAPRHLIRGQWCNGEGETIDILNPASGETLASFKGVSIAQLDMALQAAQDGYAVWRQLPPLERHAVLLRAAALLRDRADAIGRQMTLENGKPLRESIEEVVRSSRFLEWDAGEGLRAYGHIVPGVAGTYRMALREPIGPVAAFTPWNFPISSPARKLGATLAAGCSVILKASEETPAAAVAIVQALADAGVPPGAVGLVFGNPAQISDYLIRSPVIRAITFTGSVPVGKLLASLAGKMMKPAVMELGGHAPVVIGKSVDVAKVAALAAKAKFRNAGQVCTSPTRFIVHRSIHDAFVAAMSDAARAIKVGNGFDESTQMGPVVNGRRLETIEAMVADARTRGGVIASGGERLGSEGFFYAPTVLTDVPVEADILQNEPFGPLAPVIRFDTVEDALAEANRLPYGLFSYVFSNDQVEVNRLITGIEAGMVSVNNFGTSQPDTPFGGVKDSGLGREGGLTSLDAFMVTKFVNYQVDV